MKSKIVKSMIAFILCGAILGSVGCGTSKGTATDANKSSEKVNLSLLVPLYSFMASIKAISTYWGIIIIHVTFQLPISIFLFTNFIKTIPKELDEAATLDGCSVFSIFYRIILPLLKPVTATVIILTGVAVWNDYQFSLYFLQNSDKKVVSLAISSFFSTTGTNLNAAAASAIMAIIPITVLYISLQKYFVKGMVDSAIK